MVVTLAAGVWVFFRLYVKRSQVWNKYAITGIMLVLTPALLLQIPYLLNPLWDTLPLFRLIQFAYRWNILIVLASAVYCTLYVLSSEQKYVQWFIGILSAVTILIAVGFFIANNGLNWQYRPHSSHIDPPEYLPSTADKDFIHAEKILETHEMDDIILTQNDSAHFHIFSVTSEGIRFSKEETQHEIPIIFHRMYFPAWHLRASNGSEIRILSDSVGRIDAILPATAGEYELNIEETQPEKTGKIISLAGLSLLAISLLLTISWRNPKAS